MKKVKKYTIIVADDHRIVCKGIACTIKNEECLHIQDEAASFAELSDLLLRNTYDLLILDLQLGDRNGVSIVREISDRFPDMKILVLSALPDDPYAIQSIHAGASGYLNKATLLEDLHCAIDSILEGDIYLNRLYMSSLPYGTPLEKTSKNTLASLSKQEFEVYQLIGKGLSYKEIAQRLGLHTKTVSTYRMRILAKLELSNTTQLIQHALRNM